MMCSDYNRTIIVHSSRGLFNFSDASSEPVGWDSIRLENTLQSINWLEWIQIDHIVIICGVLQYLSDESKIE